MTMAASCGQLPGSVQLAESPFEFFKPRESKAPEMSRAYAAEVNLQDLIRDSSGYFQANLARAQCTGDEVMNDLKSSLACSEVDSWQCDLAHKVLASPVEYEHSTSQDSHCFPAFVSSPTHGLVQPEVSLALRKASRYLKDLPVWAGEELLLDRNSTVCQGQCLEKGQRCSQVDLSPGTAGSRVACRDAVGYQPEGCCWTERSDPGQVVSAWRRQGAAAPPTTPDNSDTSAEPFEDHVGSFAAAAQQKSAPSSDDQGAVSVGEHTPRRSRSEPQTRSDYGYPLVTQVQWRPGNIVEVVDFTQQGPLPPPAPSTPNSRAPAKRFAESWRFPSQKRVEQKKAEKKAEKKQASTKCRPNSPTTAARIRAVIAKIERAGGVLATGSL